MALTPRKIACIILAAGKGERMKSALPKPLHEVAGRSMLRHVIATAEELQPEKIVVVTGPGMQDVAEAARPHAVAVQPVINGTGGAVLAAQDHFRDFDGDIVVLYGDAPLVTAETARRMTDIRGQFPAVGLVYAGSRLEDPAAYGRMLLDEDGALKKIVELKDCTAEERKENFVWGGFLCADGAKLFGWLAQVKNDNAAREYYLTSLPQIARLDNRLSHAVEIPAEEMRGANDRAELAALERIMQDRLRRKHMLNGATLTDPGSVFFSHDTVVGRDVTIEPGVFFGPGVTVADNAVIRAHSHIAGAEICAGASVGPFARLRPGTRIGAGAKVGNFVETKNARLEAGAKAGHLSYLGDAEIGAGANIGAGTITCNYDGFSKHRTLIGANAFIGSNTALVAPVSIGAGAIVGAGSTVTKNVEADALAVARAPQRSIEGGAETFRKKRKK